MKYLVIIIGMILMFLLILLAGCNAWAKDIIVKQGTTTINLGPDYYFPVDKMETEPEVHISSNTPSALWRWESTGDTDCDKKWKNYLAGYSPNHPDCQQWVKVPYKIEGWHCVEWKYNFSSSTFTALNSEICIREEGYREDGSVVWRKPQ